MFRDRLKILRERANLSQSELAAKLDVHPVCISNWETGKRRPSVDDLATIAAALGLPSEALLLRDQRDLIQDVIDWIGESANLTPTTMLLRPAFAYAG